MENDFYVNIKDEFHFFLTWFKSIFGHKIFIGPPVFYNFHAAHMLKQI